MESFKQLGATVAVVVGLLAAGFLVGQAFGDQDADASGKANTEAQMLGQLKQLNTKLGTLDASVDAVNTSVGDVGTRLGTSSYDSGSVLGALHSMQGNLYDICRATAKTAATTSSCSLFTKR